MTSGNSGHKNQAHIIHFQPYLDPDDTARHNAYVGQRNALSYLWLAADLVEVYVHDEITPGGLLVAEAASLVAITARLDAIEAQLPDDFITSVAIDAVAKTLTLATQTQAPIVTDITELLDNVNVVPGVYALAGATIQVPLTNGTTLDLNTSALASDAELAAALAALPADDVLDSVVVNSAGVATFMTSSGATAGTLDVATIVSGLANDLMQPTISGTTVSFPLAQGTTLLLDLSTLNETLTDNGDGTVTWSDGEGGSFTFAVDTDDQVLASADNTVTVTPVTLANGQIDYDLSIKAWTDANLRNNADTPLIA